MNKITSSSAAAAPQAAASRGTLLAGICTAAKAVVPAGGGAGQIAAVHACVGLLPACASVLTHSTVLSVVSGGI